MNKKSNKNNHKKQVLLLQFLFVSVFYKTPTLQWDKDDVSFLHTYFKVCKQYEEESIILGTPSKMFTILVDSFHKFLDS